MNLITTSTNKGSCAVSFCVDYHRMEVYFETTIALYSNDTFKGLYKKYTFSTLKAANNKFEYLVEKHGLRNYRG